MNGLHEVPMKEAVSAGLEVVTEQHAAPWQERNTTGWQQPRQPIGQRRVCGLRFGTFSLAVALVIVITVAAVGGGVGGSLAVKNAESMCGAITTTLTVAVPTASMASPASPASTASPVATSSGFLVVPTTGVLALDCPNLEQEGDQVVTFGTKSWTFTPTCNKNAFGDDMLAVIVYSFHDCLQACGSMNSNEDNKCVGVAFWSNLTDTIDWIRGNCFLKKGRGTWETKTGNVNVVAFLKSAKTD